MFLRIPANKAGEVYLGLQSLIKDGLNLKDFLMKIELVRVYYYRDNNAFI